MIEMQTDSSDFQREPVLEQLEVLPEEKEFKHITVTVFRYLLQKSSTELMSSFT